MPRYSGITTQADVKRKQHTGQKKNLRKWQIVKSFPTREAALAWLKTQPGDKDPQTNPAPGEWLAYTFEYDVG